MGRAGKTNRTSTGPGTSPALGHPRHHHQATRLWLCSVERGRQALCRVGSAGSGGWRQQQDVAVRQVPSFLQGHQHLVTNWVLSKAPKRSTNTLCTSPCTVRVTWAATVKARALPEEGCPSPSLSPALPSPRSSGRLASCLGASCLVQQLSPFNH